MFNIRIGLFLPAILLIVQVVSANDKYRCPASELDKFDQFTARVISFTSHQRKLPESKVSLPKYCSETKQDIVDINDIVQKCFTGSAKQFATIIMYSVKKTINLYCSPRAKRRQDSLISMARCVTKNEKASHKCLAIYTDSLQRGKRAELSSSRIGYACCDYYKFLNCMESITKANCPHKAATSIQEFVRNIFQSIIDVACGDYVENSDKCERLKAPPKKRKSDKETRTFFLPLVELWNNLE